MYTSRWHPQQHRILWQIAASLIVGIYQAFTGQTLRLFCVTFTYEALLACLTASYQHLQLFSQQLTLGLVATDGALTVTHDLYSSKPGGWV